MEHNLTEADLTTVDKQLEILQEELYIKNLETEGQKFQQALDANGYLN